MSRIVLSFLMLMWFVDIIAQSFYFGPKLGPAINFQNWNENDESPMFSINGDLFIETAPEDEKNYLFASIGYRTRGSAWRFNNFNPGTIINLNASNFKYKNVVLEVGAKRMLFDKLDSKPYYYIGLRLEYNIGNNLDNYLFHNSYYFPNKIFIKKVVYGPSFGGGYEFNFRPLVNLFVEVGINPDINAQYFQPSIANVPDPFFPGMVRTLQERTIRNVSLEFKVGVKFLRKVEYID